MCPFDTGNKELRTLSEWYAAVMEQVQNLSPYRPLLVYSLASTPTQQVWVYPDGSKTLCKPKEGERFNIYDPFMHVIDKSFVWSDADGGWIEVTPHPNNYINMNIDDDFEFFVNLGNGKSSGPECECGAESTGSNKHYTWCKKWDPKD